MFFSLFLVCFKSVHERFFSHFSRWTNRWTLELRGMLKGGGTVRLVGLAIPDSPIAVLTHLPCVTVLFKHGCKLGWMRTLGRSGDRY